MCPASFFILEERSKMPWSKLVRVVRAHESKGSFGKTKGGTTLEKGQVITVYPGQMRGWYSMNPDDEYEFGALIEYCEDV